MAKKFKLKSVHNVDTTDGVIWQKILLFAIPILLMNFLQQLYNTIDMIIVGNYASDTALGAVGATGPVTNLLVAVFLGISTGSSVVVSQTYAGGEYKKLHHAVHSSIFIGILNGLILVLIGLLFTEPMLRLMNTPDILFHESATYMKIIFIGMIPTSLYNMASAILRAVGDSRRPLIFLLIAAVVNLILDMILVAGLGLGVAGAAWATFAAQTVSAILAITTLARSDTPYRLFLKEIHFDKEMSLSILKIGIPAGLQSAVVSSANTIVQSQINAYGYRVIEGYAAESRINGFFFMTVNSFSLAMTTFVGQNIGAHQYHRVKKGIRMALGLGCGLVFLLGIIVFGFQREFLALFNVHEESIQYGMQMLSITCIFYFLFGIGDILSGVFRGAGNAFFPMLSAIINMFGVRILWVFLAQQVHPDPISVFLSYPVSWVTMALTMLIYYRSGRWMPREMRLYTQVEKGV